MTKEVEKLKEKLREEPKSPLVPTKGVSTGSTLLNLACSNHPEWGFPLGSYVLVVGDSQSGKSFLTLTSFAEATINHDFDNYQFIYDGAEYGALMDLHKFFGKAAHRIKPPGFIIEYNGTARVNDSVPTYSQTAEDLFYSLDDKLSDGPCIYVQDSIDSLSSNDEQDKFKEHKKWVQKGKKGQEPSGTYGTSKAKIFSSYLRELPAKLQKTNSIFIAISQTRDNIGFGSMFQPKVRSGGHALTFYASLELWSSIKKRIHKTVSGHKVEVGIKVQVKVKKNRITGRENEVLLPIYWASGFDDVGGMIDWLIDWDYWKVEKQGKQEVITAPELSLSRSYDDLITVIESDGLQSKLIEIVTQHWKEIEEKVSVKRRNKYAVV